MITRLQPNDRKAQILEAAVTVANLNGFSNMQRKDIADLADVSPGLVTKYFNSMKKLKKAVMQEAIKQEHLKIVAEGIVTKDKTALKAADVIKKAALNSLV